VKYGRVDEEYKY